MGKSLRINKALIRADYIAGGTTCAKLAEKYGVSLGFVKSLCRSEGWVKLRQEAYEKTLDKTMENYIESFAPKLDETLALTAQIAERSSLLKLMLLDKVLDAIQRSDFSDGTELRDVTDEGFITAITRLRDLSGALKDLDVLELLVKQDQFNALREDKKTAHKVDVLLALDNIQTNELKRKKLERECQSQSDSNGPVHIVGFGELSHLSDADIQALPHPKTTAEFLAEKYGVTVDDIYAGNYGNEKQEEEIVE